MEKNSAGIKGNGRRGTAQHPTHRTAPTAARMISMATKKKIWRAVVISTYTNQLKQLARLAAAKDINKGASTVYIVVEGTTHDYSPMGARLFPSFGEAQAYAREQCKTITAHINKPAGGIGTQEGKQ